MSLFTEGEIRVITKSIEDYGFRDTDVLTREQREEIKDEPEFIIKGIEEMQSDFALRQLPNGTMGEAAVYKLWSGKKLLYVGKSTSLFPRLTSHTSKPWSHFVDRITIERYLTEKEALTAEKRSIENEGPEFNHIHNQNNPNKLVKQFFAALKYFGFSEVKDEMVH